uniref:NAD(P)-binding domain-containing protein n=1 Tax=Picea sitchensis TaxID=3332 RepID=D5A8X6_PICSI|nr:unknown [Picea sitchensis]
MEGQLQKVLVVGCTKGVGLQVTKLLLGSPGKYDVHALVRSRERASKALGNEAAKVKFIDGDITKEDTFQPACNGMDAVVCTVGAAAGWRIPGYNQSTPKHVDFLGVKNLSEAAASAMVPKFVVISSVAVTRPWYWVSIFLNTFMGREFIWKLKGEEALKEAYKKHEHISYYIIRPGGLTNREGGKHGIVVDQGDKGDGWITRVDVAHVALACVNGACTPNSTFEIWNSKEEGTPDLSKLLELVPDKM